MPDKSISGFGCGIAAALSFAVFCYQEYFNQHVGASIAAALCLAMTFIATQNIETFEGLGIKTKLRSTLNKAEQRLEGIDTLLCTLANATFFQIARGSLANTERRNLTSQLTSSLKQLGIADNIISSLKAPLFYFIASGCWYAFGGVRANHISQALNAALSEAQSKSAGAENGRARAEYERLNKSVESECPTISNFSNLRLLLEKSLAKTPLPKLTDHHIFTEIISELSNEFDACIVQGNLTEKMIYILNQSARMDSDYMQSLSARCL